MKKQLLLALSSMFLFGTPLSVDARCREKCKDREQKCVQKWDYVIVGGGTSGCELANILSADLTTSVLLIEAGPNYDYVPVPVAQNMEIPFPNADNLAGYFSATYDWQQVSVGQTNVITSAGTPATFPYSNGRLLGGSSCHNGTQYMRQSNPNLMAWDVAVGGSGDSTIWGPSSVNAAYIAIENYNGTINGLGDIRGHTGPIQVRQCPVEIQLSCTQVVDVIGGVGSPVLPAMQQLGIFKDYNDNGNVALGVSYQWQLDQAWMPTGTTNIRQGSSIVFIDPITDPVTGRGIGGRKLQVLTNSMVNKILFDGLTAVGVAYTDDAGDGQVAYASKEIIVSSGAFSCEVLMRSGVGNYTNPNAYTNSWQAPWAELSASNIPPVFNNENVGQNLTNHPLVIPVVLEATSPIVGTDVNCLFSVNAMFPGLEYDAAGHIVPANSDRTTNIFFGPAGGSNTPVAFAAMQLLKNDTVGSVVIRSRDPIVNSLEDPNLFGDHGGGANSVDLQQMELLLSGSGNPGHIDQANGPFYNLLVALTTPTPAGYGWTLLSPATLTPFEEKGSLDAFIFANIIHSYHYAGTCRMGTSSLDGVVDTQCRVFGVNRLRVIDVSVAPVQPDCNTGSVAWVVAKVIGPKIADGTSPAITSN